MHLNDKRFHASVDFYNATEGDRDFGGFRGYFDTFEDAHAAANEQASKETFCGVTVIRAEAAIYERTADGEFTERETFTVDEP